MFRSKAAVIGTGFIGPVHIEGLIRAGVQVQGVLGTSFEKSKRTADLFGIKKAYRDLDELVGDDEVNVVHLTSPNRFHFEQTIRCLDAGKHVLCEKPLAMNSEESGELAWNSQRPDELWVGNRDSANQTLLRDPGLLSDPARSHAQYPGGHNEGFPDTFKQLFRSFYTAIEKHETSGQIPFADYPTFADGHREILLCEAILRSAREQRWIELGTHGT